MFCYANASFIVSFMLADVFFFVVHRPPFKDVTAFLGREGLGEYAAAFAREQINGDFLLHDLDDDILTELG